MNRALQDYIKKLSESTSVPYGARFFALNSLAMVVLGAAGGHKLEWTDRQTLR